MMKRYFLPVCFAAAAHGALLFGFTKSPRSQPPSSDQKTWIPWKIAPPPPAPPEVVLADSSASNSKPAPEMPQPPRSAEPVVVAVDHQLTMTPPPFARIAAENISLNLVPPGVVGGQGNEPWLDGVLSSALDNPPRTRFQATPNYPFEAKQKGVRGEVHVEFMVNEAGRVVDPRIVSSSDRMFEEPTLRAVSRWQFAPGRRHGRIVAFRMTVPVIFNLNE